MVSRSKDRTPVTVIGLGLMGSALAGAFVNAGHPTTVWNRTPDKADDLVAKGAILAATAADAISASPLVIVNVRDYDAMHEILDPADDALAGRVLVNLTSGSSQEGRETASWTAERGAEYLDGAIMMTPAGIGDPQTVILYDVALLDIMWTTLNGFLHALALVGTEHIEATTFLPHATGFLAGVGSFMATIAEEVDQGRYTARDASLQTHLSPLKHLIHESKIRGIDTELPEYTKTLLERSIADGHTTDSYARLIEHFRNPPA